MIKLDYSYNLYLVESVAGAKDWTDVELGKLLHCFLHSPSLALLLCVCVFDDQR